MIVLECENLKYHMIADHNLVDSVKSDIEIKYKKKPQEVVDFSKNPKQYVWDPGGIIFVDDVFFDFKLADVEVSCRSQHWFEFKNSVRSSTIQNGYSKLYGWISIICLSVEQREQLLVQISEKEEEYDKVALTSVETMDRAVQSLVDQGKLVSQRFEKKLVNKNLN